MTQPARGFGRFIRARRKAAGETQMSTAYAMGCTQGWLSKLEMGHGEPTFRDMVALSRFLRFRLSTAVRALEM